MGQTLSGIFTFAQTTSTNGTKVVRLGFTDVQLFLGDASTDPDLTDGTDLRTGLVLSQGTGALLLLPGGMAGSFSAHVELTQPLKDRLGAGFGTSVTVKINTLTTAVNDKVMVDGTELTLSLPRGPYLRASLDNAVVTFGDYKLTGSFLFEKSIDYGSDKAPGGSTTATQDADVLTVALLGLNLFKKNSSAVYEQFPLSNMNGVLLVVTKGGQTGYVLNLSAQLTNDFLPPLFPKGQTLSAVVNTTTSAVDKVIEVNGTQFALKADPGGTSPLISVTAKGVAFNFGDVLEIRGDFTIDSNGDFSITNAQVFVGKGPSTSDDAIGLLITNASVKFHKFDTTNYALAVTGGVALVGLDGLKVSGGVSFKINTSTTTCTAAAGPCGPVLDVAAQTFSLVVSDMHIGVAGVLDINGTLLVTRQPNGTLDLMIGNASVLVALGGTGIIKLGGFAAFSISPTTGFRLSTFRVSSFELFPTDLPSDFGGAPAPSAGFAAAAAGSSANPQAPKPVLFPTADLFRPFNGGIIESSKLLENRPECNNQKCLIVRFNDLNQVGLNPTSIEDPAGEFEVWVNGAKVDVTFAKPVAVTGQVNTWAYVFSGWTPANGLVEIRFLAGGVTDNNGIGSAAETERFFVVTGPDDKPGPIATVASPGNGETLSAADLNARRYIDVTYTSLDGKPINKASITDAAAEFRLEGPGVLDVMLDSAGSPVLVGLPLLISGTALGATSVTYRYFLKDRNKTNTVDLFGPGEVRVVFQASYGATDSSHPYGTPAWASTTNQDTPIPLMDANKPGWNILGLTQTFTLSNTAAGGLTAGGPINLGPLSLQGPTIGIGDVGFEDGMLILTIVVGVNRASLDFGNKTPTTNGATSTGTTTGTPQATTGSQSTAGVTVDLIGLQGTFDLAVDAFGLLSGNVRIEPTGKWGIRVASLEAEVPNLALLTAEGISFGYDPNHDPASGPQELLRIASAKITFPTLGVTGSLRPYDPTARRNVAAPADDEDLAAGLVPGLIVYDNGFKIGVAELAYGLPPLPPGQTTQPGNELTKTGTTGTQTDKNIDLFGILRLDDLRVGVQNVSVTFGTTTTFSGTIYIATGGAVLFPGKAFTASVTDRTTADDVNSDGTPNTEALRASLVLTGDHVDAFQLEVDTLSIKLGQFVTLSAVGASLNTGAGPTDYLVHFLSVGATVKIGSVELSGAGNNFGFLGNGSFKADNGFGVFLSIGSATGDSFKWPSFLPVRLDAIGVEWVDVENHPEDFVLVLSASVTGIKGLGALEFSGSIQGVRIQPSLLAEGKFPIISIDSLGITVKGKMFGGEVNAGLIGGILRLDKDFHEIGEFDRTTPVAQRVFYLGLQGGFSLAGMSGFTIRLGLSELGPLQVFVNISTPTGVLLVPQIGLTLNDFSAGVEFFKTLPSIDDPFALRNAAFSLPTEQTADTWLTSLKAQVGPPGEDAEPEPVDERLRGGLHSADDVHRLRPDLLAVHLAAGLQRARHDHDLHRRQVPDPRATQLRRRPAVDLRPPVRRPVPRQPGQRGDPLPRRHPGPGPDPHPLRQDQDGLQGRLRPGRRLHGAERGWLHHRWRHHAAHGRSRHAVRQRRRERPQGPPEAPRRQRPLHRRDLPRRTRRHPRLAAGHGRHREPHDQGERRDRRQRLGTHGRQRRSSRSAW